MQKDLEAALLNLLLFAELALVGLLCCGMGGRCRPVGHTRSNPSGEKDNLLQVKQKQNT